MTTATPACPECQGPQWLGDPRGLLLIDHGNACSLRAAEDSTHLADLDRLGGVRPATATERTLLTALGYETPDGLTTHVQPLTDSTVRRTWEQLTTITGGTAA